MKSFSRFITVILSLSMIFSLTTYSAAATNHEADVESAAIQALEEADVSPDVIDTLKEKKVVPETYAANVAFVSTAEQFHAAVADARVNTIILMNDIEFTKSQLSIDRRFNGILSIIAMQDTVIDLKDVSADGGLHVWRAHVSFTNITIKSDGGTAISMGFSTIEGAVLKDTETGISGVENTSDNKIIDCTITNTTTGIKSRYADILIDNCMLTHNKTGMELLTNQTYVTNTTISKNETGAIFMSDFKMDNCVIEDNTIRGIEGENLGFIAINNSKINFNGSLDNEINGAGLYLSGHNKDYYFLTNCEIKYNKTSGDGGGIYEEGPAKFCSVFLDGTEVEGNSAARGGGIFTGNYVNLGNSKINNNIAEIDGGGIFLEKSSENSDYPDRSFIGTNTEIKGNKAGSYGGGIYLDAGKTISLFTVNITENRAYRGGGIFAHSRKDISMTDETKVERNISRFGGDIWPN